MKLKDILSAAGAALLFLALLMGAHWDLWISAVIAVIVYFALTFLLTPQRKIGGVDVEKLEGGEKLEETFSEAGADLDTIKKCAAKASSDEIRGGAQNLVQNGKNIIRYLEKHVDKIPQARRFLNYYLDTAADILSRYIEFQNSQAPAEDMRSVTKNTSQALQTLNEAFSHQYSRLLEGEVMNMEVDVDVLKTMVKSDFGDSPFQVSGKKNAGAAAMAAQENDTEREG